MQQGGSQYGVPPPDMAPFTATATGGARSQLLGGIPSSDHFPSTQPMAEAVPPINSRPPQPQPQPQPPNTANLEELATTVSGNFHDDEAFAVGEEAERSGAPGNRWPREETLALIKIRSDMDATFRDATLKGPLWDEVSRKLAEQGYIRSAKKCKEKFENVHKYYKRTKEGRAGRQDGKSYRFFAQLEALHNIGSGSGGSTAGTPTNHQSSSAAAFGMSGARFQPTPLSSVAPLNANPRHVTDQFGSGSAPTTGAAADAVAAGISFSTNSSSSESSATDEEDTEEGLVGRKRKRRSSGGGSRKTMAFFKDLMKQLMDQQETMQQRFLETIEKREQDRMIREEAWKRQEMARLTREHEAMAQERAMSATRDTAIITFLQKITGQTIQLPQPIPVPATATPPQATAPVATQPPPQQPSPQPKHHHHRHQQNTETSRSQPNPETNIVAHDQRQEMGIGGSGTDPASSRWPKTEVHALIKLRSGMESRYQDAGPKGPLWEEISIGMKQMGYNRSSKRCKEKWENINKYFKKVKESNKKRPEDAKTCPYFYQLDALYRKKSLAGAGSASGNSFNQTKEGQQEPNPPNSQLRCDVVPISTLPPPPPPPLQEHPADPEENGNGGNNKGASAAQTSNGDPQTGFFQENTGGRAAMKKIRGYAMKPEDIMKELIMEQHQTTGIDDYDKDSDNMDEEEDEEEEEDDDDDDEEQKMAYKIEYQRPNVGSASNGGGASSSVAGVAAAGSFLAMVQ